MMSSEVNQSCKKASPSCGLSSLPDEMVLNCFARVSTLDHAALSMVSKSYRSLVLSPELHQTRSRMDFTENYVYVFINTKTPSEPNQLSFILRRVKGKPTENRLISIPSFQIPRCSSLVALCGGIYVIGGYIKSANSSIVSFLDCRTHKWSYVPPMRIARAYAHVGVYDGKIYVMGGCKKKVASIWAEVFDPKLQIWSRVNIKDPKIKYFWHDIFGTFRFRAEESTWNDLYKGGHCDIERLLYCRDAEGDIVWCEPWSEVRQGRMHWRKVYGLDAMRESFRFTSGSIGCAGEFADEWHYYMLKHGYIDGLSLPGPKLSICDGNIVIFWSKLEGENLKRLQIWCTEISVERRERDEIWGNVQWTEHVSTFVTKAYPGFIKDLQSVTVNV